MNRILTENYITSYDDMVYESGPNKFKNFLSDKYNKVHNELYNNALQKYYKYLLDTCISIEFLYELFTIMKNNSDTVDDLYNAIMNSNNVPTLKNALISVCCNSKEFIKYAYTIIFEYLDELKTIMAVSIVGITDKDDIEDFTASYIDSSTFIRPENDEVFDHTFKTYLLDSETDELEIHNFYMSEMSDYVLILEAENGLRIGFNRKGNWVIILDGAQYISSEAMINTLLTLKRINEELREKLKLKAREHFNLYHRTIEIKNNEYWKPSSIIVISKISPYRKHLVNLKEWWNKNYEQSNTASIDEIKVTNENILDSEVVEVNYISGKAKLYSKNADVTYEVPFEYLDKNTVLSDSMLLKNTFRGNY